MQTTARIDKNTLDNLKAKFPNMSVSQAIDALLDAKPEEQLGFTQSKAEDVILDLFNKLVFPKLVDFEERMKELILHT